MNTKKFTSVRKIISTMLVLSIVMICGVISASATSLTFTPSASSASAGDIITFSIVAGDATGTSAGDLELSYDAAVLEFVADSVKGSETDMCVGGSPEAGTVTCGFIFADSCKGESFKVCDVQFKVLKDDADTTVTPVVSSWSGADEPVVEAIELKLEPKGDEPTTKDDEPTTVKDDEPTTKDDEPTTVKDDEPTTKKDEPVSEDTSVVLPTKGSDKINQTGDAATTLMFGGIGLAVAAIAFVATYVVKIKKQDEE